MAKNKSKSSSTSVSKVKYDRKGEKVGNFSVARKSGSDHGLIAQWTHPKYSQADGYEYDWEYLVGSKWLPGTNGTVSVDYAKVDKRNKNNYWFRHEWNAPSDAVAARCHVRPVSKEKPKSQSSSSSTSNSNKKGTKTTSKSTSTQTTLMYFSASWSSYATHDFRNDKLPTPTVTVTLNEDGTKATVAVSCEDEDCNFCTIVAEERNGKDASNNWKYAVKKKWADKACPDGEFSGEFSLSAGHTWYFRAFCSTDKKYTKGDSDWSSRVAAEALPTKPGDPTAKATGDDSANVTWDAASGADTYTVEYCQDENHFKNNPSLVTSVTGIVGTTFAAVGLESGHRWYFRVKAVNDSGESAFTNATSCLLATVPDAPTTFETEPSFMRGESVLFRWAHNCEDGSEQRAYEINLDVYDSDGTNAVKTTSAISVSSNGSFAIPNDFVSLATGHPKDVTDGMSASDLAQLIEYKFNASKLGSGIVYCWTYPSNVTFNASNHTGSMAAELALLAPADYGTLSNIKITGLKYHTSHAEQTLSGTTDEHRSFALSNITDGALVQWKVRTKGAHDSWSPWSASRSFYVYEQASLTCAARKTNASGATVDESHPMTSFPLAIVLDASGGGNQVAGYHVTIVAAEAMSYVDGFGYERVMGAGEVAFERDYAVSSDPYTAIVGAGDNANLRDTGVYQIIADVAMKSGLRATATPWRFAVDYDVEVPEPSVTVTFDDEDLTADVMPACYTVDSNGDSTTTLMQGVTLAVYRIDDDGTLVLLRDGIPNDGSAVVVDPHANFGECWYHVVATHTATGVCNFTDGGAQSPHHTTTIQWDESWQKAIDADDLGARDYDYSGMMMDSLYNVKHDETGNVQAEDVEYIGREHPVSYYGTQMGYEAQFQVDFPYDDMETLKKARRLLALRDDAYVREPRGTGYWAHIVNPKLSRSTDSLKITLSFTARRVDRDDSALEEVE